MKYSPKGAGDFELDTIVLDLNGTLAVNGEIVSGVKGKLDKLKELGYKIVLFTGNQRGNADELCAGLGIEYKIAQTGEEKEAMMSEFDSEKTVSIGNARIDIGTFKHAKVRIATLQAEGIHSRIIQYVDLIVPSINDALDLLINKDIFEATMRL